MYDVLFPCRDEFAYATSDGVVYVRQFALSPEDMCLLASLEGHHAEVTQVRHSIGWLLESIPALHTYTCTV